MQGRKAHPGKICNAFILSKMKKLSINPKILLELEIRRLLLAYHQRMLAFLQAKRNADEAVHQSRLCIKRIRAIHRLIRSGIGETAFVQQQAFYRQLTMSLGSLRDKTACIETLSGLISNRKSPVTNKLIRKYVAVIRKQRDEMMHAAIDKELFRDMFHTIKQHDVWVIQLKLDGLDQEIIFKGMRKMYLQAAGIAGKLALAPTDIGFHQFRKKVKYLGYALETLQELHPAMISYQVAELSALGRLLGKHHDLVLVLAAVEAGDRNAAQVNLIRSIKALKAGLEQRILTEAKLVFAWDAKAFAERYRTLIVLHRQ